MGIQNLFDVIRDKCPEEIIPFHLSQLRGLSFAIDVSIFFNKYVKSGGEYWVRCFFTFLCTFKKYGIKSVCIFDGPNPPIEKKKEQEGRVKQTDKAKARLQRAIEIRKILKGVIDDDEDFEDEDLQDECKEIMGTRRKNPKAIRWDDPLDIDDSLKELISRLEKQTAPITDEQRILAWEIVQLMGIPVFQADGEAEALCAYLAINGYVDGVLSEDGDTLAYGAPWMFAFKDFKLNDEKVYGIHLPNVLEKLEYNMDEFLDLCILLSCDYNSRVKGYPPDGKKHKKACSIGMTGALSMINVYRNLEACEEYIEDIEPLIYERCREIFTTFNQEDYTQLIKIKPYNGKPNYDSIQTFLEENDIIDMISVDYIRKCWTPTEIEILDDENKVKEIYVLMGAHCSNSASEEKPYGDVEFYVKYKNLKSFDEYAENDFDDLLDIFNDWLTKIYPKEEYLIESDIEAINVLNKPPKKEKVLALAEKLYKYINIEGENYWKGPYGIYVHESLKSVVADDGINSLFKDGSQTEIAEDNSEEEALTKKGYFKKYAEKRGDKYFYIRKDDDFSED